MFKTIKDFYYWIKFFPKRGNSSEFEAFKFVEENKKLEIEKVAPGAFEEPIELPGNKVSRLISTCNN
jgi:hypothetical protein